MTVALFSQATLTFHVRGLFRTSPGWNLWMSGSPNSAKDGISPLSGVIMTDGSPYSFTMKLVLQARGLNQFQQYRIFLHFAPNRPLPFDRSVPAIARD